MKLQFSLKNRLQKIANKVSNFKKGLNEKITQLFVDSKSILHLFHLLKTFSFSQQIRKRAQNRIFTLWINFIAIMAIFTNLLGRFISFTFIMFMLSKAIVCCWPEMLRFFIIFDLKRFFKLNFNIYVSIKLMTSISKCSSLSSLCSGCRASSQIDFFKQLSSYPILKKSKYAISKRNVTKNQYHNA